MWGNLSKEFSSLLSKINRPYIAAEFNLTLAYMFKKCSYLTSSMCVLETHGIKRLQNRTIQDDKLL
jgi:hypothetical protein